VRPDWDDYFLGIATAVATRADCTRRQVGAVIVKDHRIVSCGYNGAPPGQPGCLSGACPRGKLSYEEIAPMSSYDTGAGSCISVHAEQNAIIYGDYARMVEGTIYITDNPCDGCMKMILGARISRIVTPSLMISASSLRVGGNPGIGGAGGDLTGRSVRNHP